MKECNLCGGTGKNNGTDYHEFRRALKIVRKYYASRHKIIDKIERVDRSNEVLSVAKKYIDEHDLLLKNREQERVARRHALMMILHEHKLAKVRISNLLGMNHCSVIHGIKRGINADKAKDYLFLDMLYEVRDFFELNKENKTT